MRRYTTHRMGAIAFAKADDLFESLKGSLASPELRNSEHGEIEMHIKKEGYEIMRLLLQGYLDIRTETELNLGSVNHRNLEHDYVRKNTSRAIKSIFGKVQPGRMGYSMGGEDSVFPLDAALNFPSDRYSDGLRRQLASSFAYKSFDQAVLDVIENTATSIPKRQIENIASNLSRDFDAFYVARQIDIHSKTDILVLSCDGKGIVMRKDDLRPATKKAAQSEEHKKQTRLSKGEKRNRKRMATVATVYDIEPLSRSAESIMDKAKLPDGAVVPKPTQKRVWASVEKPAKEVIEDMFQEALRRDPKRERQWVILVDGHKSQLKQIKKVMKQLQVDAPIVLDFIHVLEYLWKAAYCFYDESSKEAEQWVKQRALNVLNGKAGQVAGGIRRSCTKLNLSSKKRKGADKCSKYLLNNKGHLKYDESLITGCPIATGVIEGACRHLIKDRMDITGARWRLKGAEAILKIRALVVCGDFDEYFRFHKKQEQKRNYPFYEQISNKMAA